MVLLGAAADGDVVRGRTWRSTSNTLAVTPETQVNIHLVGVAVKILFVFKEFQLSTSRKKIVESPERKQFKALPYDPTTFDRPPKSVSSGLPI